MRDVRLPSRAEKGRKVMKHTKCSLKLFVSILFVILCLFLNLHCVYAQDIPNTITFDNQSGEPAVVKLIGPTKQSVEIPNGEKRTVNVAAGEYYILSGCKIITSYLLYAIITFNL